MGTWTKSPGLRVL